MIPLRWLSWRPERSWVSVGHSRGPAHAANNQIHVTTDPAQFTTCNEAWDQHNSTLTPPHHSPQQHDQHHSPHRTIHNSNMTNITHPTAPLHIRSNTSSQMSTLARRYLVTSAFSRVVSLSSMPVWHRRVLKAFARCDSIVFEC